MPYHPSRIVSVYLQNTFGALVRAMFTTMVLGIVLIGMLHLMGVPVPGPYRLLHEVESLSAVHRILS
jgi:hypothetical protein